ncbi:YDG/SRA domain-containing protein [Chloroflexota bacterium]
MIGHVSGVWIGQIFPDRRALHDANVHRGLQQGISADGSSIVLSGGYVDDVDEGDFIIYTGEGGRSQDSGRQIADQTLTRGNAALARNYVKGNPIRVNRGNRLKSSYAPISGYRYDGLYRIDHYWQARGQDGFMVWKYRLIRLEGQVPVGQTEEEIQGNNDNQNVSTDIPPRSFLTTSRIIRNTLIGNEVKEMYDYACQICGIRLETPSGPYAECCHIRPLGRPHNGSDGLDNVLCLCPNHHALFDNHAIHLTDDLMVAETGKRISILPGHTLNIMHIRYHRSLINSSLLQ